MWGAAIGSLVAGVVGLFVPTGDGAILVAMLGAFLGAFAGETYFARQQQGGFDLPSGRQGDDWPACLPRLCRAESWRCWWPGPCDGLDLARLEDQQLAGLG